MSGILKFFLNALKAIFVGPFYVLYFALNLIVSLFVHFIGELKVLFTGFKYGSKKENKYNKKVMYKINLLKKGGDQ